ncbi:hypothetical protein Bca52824_077767 [Brassica carinata]|uniref:Uncharacterized protein n=1 Tax=Brassica carinata TaxID=52824 RepID=A0A8X7PWM8_BRACI|nr:hypothetical protein Bca52824_077767 [Brassica carinata]
MGVFNRYGNGSAEEKTFKEATGSHKHARVRRRLSLGFPKGVHVVGESSMRFAEGRLDTLPGSECLIFVYGVTKADGFHYRQPWVIGVQEEIERLTKRVEEAEEVMLRSSNLCKLIDKRRIRLKCSRAGR